VGETMTEAANAARAKDATAIFMPMANLYSEVDPSLLHDEFYRVIFSISGGRLDLLHEATKRFAEISKRQEAAQ
jgi:hypothetical protein